MAYSDKPRPVKSYMNKNIDLRDQLSKYRTMLNQKYPDPKAQSSHEETNEAPSPTKPKSSAQSKRVKKEEKVEEVAKEPEELPPERSIMEIDSVIDDGEIPDFTLERQYMRGAALSPEVIDKLDNPPK